MSFVVLYDTPRKRAFSPLSLSPALWLDATQITGLSDTDPVSTWTDSSGNGRNATGTLATRPLYRTNQINGKPAVVSDGTDDFLTLGTPVGDGFAAYTMIAVYLRTNYAAQKALYSNRHLAAPGGGTVTYWGSIVNRNFIFQDSVAPAGGLTGITALTNNQAVITGVTLSGTTRTLYTNSKTADISDVANNGAANIFSGYFFRDGADYSAMSLAEYLTFSSALSAPNLNLLLDYLAAKWGVTLI